MTVHLIQCKEVLISALISLVNGNTIYILLKSRANRILAKRRVNYVSYLTTQLLKVGWWQRNCPFGRDRIPGR